jgi:hypothetical protein
VVDDANLDVRLLAGFGAPHGERLASGVRRRRILHDLEAADDIRQTL